jgi:putative phosphoribosyl transferase
MSCAEVKGLPSGYFGASTGVASALKAVAYFRDSIKAVVSLGGRPDLALIALPEVKVPTLMLIGGIDVSVIGINKMAYDELQSVKEIKIVPGVTHLFEEPVKLLEIENLAGSWYKRHLLIKEMSS